MTCNSGLREKITAAIAASEMRRQERERRKLIPELKQAYRAMQAILSETQDLYESPTVEDDG